jgi:transcription elongation factor
LLATAGGAVAVAGGTAGTIAAGAGGVVVAATDAGTPSLEEAGIAVGGGVACWAAVPAMFAMDKRQRLRACKRKGFLPCTARVRP